MNVYVFSNFNEQQQKNLAKWNEMVSILKRTNYCSLQPINKHILRILNLF